MVLLKRPEGISHEEGGRTTLGQLRGSAAIAQLSDTCIGLERNQQADDPAMRNRTIIRVLKNRYLGMTGPAAMLDFNVDTGRLSETSFSEPTKATKAEIEAAPF